MFISLELFFINTNYTKLILFWTLTSEINIQFIISVIN